MKPRQKRIMFAALAVVGIAIATILISKALRSNMAYFFSPTQVQASEAPLDKTFRIGGLVEEGSLTREEGSLTVGFIVTDTAADIKVSYTGILPDLFKEGQGVVAKGKLGSDGVFYAKEVLAKHDETYMPPEVSDALDTAKSMKAQQAKP
ncbi:MAG TPA: cytochrome c maturation protein CcmE [Gammaproteobacteria bacterium]|nr:cytochrome c maturation protein CcmE [Gammaproteobacteria bacterium]